MGGSSAPSALCAVYESQEEEEERNLERKLGGGVHLIYTGELAKFLICRVFLEYKSWTPGKLVEWLALLLWGV